MVDFAPPWDPIPRDSMPPPHNDMSLAQVRKHAMDLADLLDENKEEQVLKEACLGLCQLFGEGIQNDRIQVILEANVVPKLVALLKPSKSRTVPISVQSAALQVLGNVACGDDRQTQVVIDSDALPCLRSLLSSTDHRIRKEVCWIVSNITESSHQVQDVLDANILPPLLKLLDNQDAACREDATWVLFNLSSNRDPTQIAYLAEKNGVRALCNLLACPKELDVMWKGCRTVAAVALKGLRNILISGQLATSSDPDGTNKMASLVAEAHGVERIEALTTHGAIEVRARARLLLERMFGAEQTSADISPPMLSPTVGSTALSSPPPPPPFGNTNCSCAFQHNRNHPHFRSAHYHANGLYDISGGLSTNNALNCCGHVAQTAEDGVTSAVHIDGELTEIPASSSGSSTDSDPDDDDSDPDLIPPPPAPCNCVLCTDDSPLPERRPRGKGPSDDPDSSRRSTSDSTQSVDVRLICDFCSGSGRLGDGRAGLAAKLGRAVRLGHTHCMAIVLSRMSWTQRIAATEAPALLHPGGGPPDGGVGNSLPAVVLAAQLGKPACLWLLLRRCRPELDVTHGKKRLTALAWAAHKSYMRCSQLLIDYGANPATKCGDGVTALHLAASGGGHVAICKLLIDHHAPVNARSAKKQTPLCLAAQKGYVKVVQILLEHGADPNNEDEGKYTPLHLSASNGFVSCVDLLLKAGARVDATTRKGVTPLHYAVQGGHDAVMKLLIAAGAKVNCNRKPLLLIAADDGKTEVVRILLDARAQVDCKANIKASLDKDSEVFDYLTPLHLAASRSHQPVVDLLLRRGANVNEMTTKSGWCALDFAVLNGNAGCAVTLLEHGATVTDKCKTLGRNSWTLVQYAAHNGAKDVVRLLIQRLKEQRGGMSTCKPSTGPFANDSVLDGRTGTEVNSENSLDKPVNDEEENATLLDYIAHEDRDDEACQQGEETRTAQPSHRYDPRSIEGDEGGFGTGPGYANSSDPVETSKSRRRVVKEDRQSTIRSRELKKRESEANDARDRLEEAINQRNVSKLTEAIAHVSKLVLHLATTTGDSSACSALSEHTDSNGYSEQYASNAQVTSPSTQTTQMSLPKNSVTTPLAMEVGLGNEVQRARKILASLLAEEKRIREVKEREVADSKRENAQQTVKKAIAMVLEGADPRTLSRSITRTTRSILDKDDPVVFEANEDLHLISELEKGHSAMNAALSSEHLDSLSEALPKVKACVLDLEKKDGTGAIGRIFGGVNHAIVIGKAGEVLEKLREKRAHDIAKEAQAKNIEKEALTSLEKAMLSNDIFSLESALARASDALICKESALGTAFESAKKVLNKWVKGERRKLRQANNTNDPDIIEKAAENASSFGLQALQMDIDSAKSLAQKLREQAALVGELDVAIENGELSNLTNLRSRLNALGMFAEAEKARSEYERLLKARRAKTLLESAVEEAKQCRDPIAEALNTSKSAEDILNVVSDWTWPDAQKLYDLSERTRKHGTSCHSLCEMADELVTELAHLGREVLGLTTKSNDARLIAALIAGYEKSFMNVSKPGAFDKSAGQRAISEAKKRLAVVQANDQESVKAESAQVKVEYALATSRRSAARIRHGRSNQARFGNHFGSSAVNTGGTVADLSNSAVAVTAGCDESASRVNMRSSVADNSEARSNSSLSSEYVDDGSDPEGKMEHSRAGEPVRLQVKKKRPGGSSVAMDDSGVRTPNAEEVTGDGSSTLTGECSHFYSFKEGSTVLCVRCGHLRSSSNPEWLARVKRRSSKYPADMIGGTVMHDVSLNDVTYQSVVADTGMRSLRGASGMMSRQEGVSVGYGMNVGVGALSDASRIGGVTDTRGVDGGAGGVGMAGVGLNMPMMMSMLHTHTQTGLADGGGAGVERTPATGLVGPGVADKGGLSQGGLGRRTHVGAGLGANRFETHPHLHGMTGAIYGGGGAGAVGVYGTEHSVVATATVQGYPLGVDAHHLGANHVGTSHVSGPQVSANHVAASAVSEAHAAIAVGADDASSGIDLGTDFANENFGFDIDAIVDDNPPGGCGFFQR